MLYYDSSERKAIEQISERVQEFAYQDWTPRDILNPEGALRMRSVGGHDLLTRSWALAGRVERLNDFEKFKEYYKFKMDFPPFIHGVRFPMENPSRYTAAHHIDLWNAFSAAGLNPTNGDAWFNYWDSDGMKRKTKLINVLRVNNSYGVYAELSDLRETNPQMDEVKGLKILMLRNPNRPNHAQTRSMCDLLVRTIICTLEYDLMWGNPLEIDDYRYSHNGTKDRRFEVYRTITVESSDGESKEFKVTRLAQHWHRLGLRLMLSPDGDGLACGAISESYKPKLLAIDEKAWRPFLEHAA